MDNKCPQCGAPLPSGVLAGLCPACLMKQGAAADTGAAPEATAFQPPGVAEVARMFPQLEIIALLGKGGMGAVYQARQPGLDRVVALKILPPQTAGGPGFVERFNREARALAKLNHPNIVAVYEFGQVNGLPYFIMEFVDGLNLREVERAGKLSAREALQIVPQICEALQYAHDEGVVHRDIKPENILLDKKGRVKIADFGIAKILSGAPEADLTSTKGAIGTPHYMAPEQMEKPTTVDHRADIFSLGVVFYEMLTGELPLGKFGPPSSRKVEVDVRLDEVVLRALEKDPERRYQHASQVKTAVDTIAGSAAPPPTANAAAMAQEILTRDYTLSIRSCVRRSWKLLKSDFWVLVGMSALFIALLGLASSFGGASFKHHTGGDSTFEMSSAVATVVWGPLMGGLFFYFLKRIRGEPVTVEMAFCGFNSGPRFLHLFLAGFVTTLLTWLGFFLIVVPGLYLLVAWMFTLPLVVDKQLDFWSAMELSRKVVSKHWFKLLGFSVVMLLLHLAGVLALIVGIFVATPLAWGALMYAYEDIFGGVTGAGQATVAAPAGVGPGGTVVIPAAAFSGPASGKSTTWTTATKIGLAAAAVVIIGFIVFNLLPAKGRVAFENARRHAERDVKKEFQPQSSFVPAPEPAPSALAVDSGPVDLAPPANQAALAFGPVIERELQMQTTGTNQFLNLDTGQLLTPPVEITGLLAVKPGWDEINAWEGLDIPQNSPRFQYIEWLRSSGADLMFLGNDMIIGFDGIFAAPLTESPTNWDNCTPDRVRVAVDFVDWTRRTMEALSRGQAEPHQPEPGGIFSPAPEFKSRESGGPIVSGLIPGASVNWYFKTRGGRMGVLQLAGFSGNPPVAQIRYKLVQLTTNQLSEVSGGGSSEDVRKHLSERLEAASSITDGDEKDKPLAVVAADAARVGEVEIAKKALGEMFAIDRRDAATHDAALLLAKRDQRKDAIAMAKGISDYTIRNQTLAELAQ